MPITTTTTTYIPFDHQRTLKILIQEYQIHHVIKY